MILRGNFFPYFYCKVSVIAWDHINPALAPVPGHQLSIGNLTLYARTKTCSAETHYALVYCIDYARLVISINHMTEISRFISYAKREAVHID